MLAGHSPPSKLTPTSVRLDEADPALRRRLCEAYGWVDDEHLVDRLAGTGFVTHERSKTLLTVAGALVLLPEPQASGGRPYVDIRRFTEGETDPDKTWEIRGPADRQVEQAVTAIEDELGSVSAIVDARRMELPRLPHRALREAIANAVAHRSSENAGTATRIELHQAAISITSPGGPPEPVTIEHIRSQTGGPERSAARRAGHERHPRRGRVPRRPRSRRPRPHSHTDSELDAIAIAQAEWGRLTNTTLRDETGLSANEARGPTTPR